MLILALVAGLIPGCATETITSPRHPTSADGPLFSTYDPATRTLGVIVLSGVNKFDQAGWYTIGSEVTGGTAPYHYHWFAQRRYEDGFVSNMELLTTRTDLSEITIYIPPDLNKITVKLSVGDADGSHTWLGDATRNWLGPAFNWKFPPEPCYGGDDPRLEYPWHDPLPPPGTTGRFRREVCGWTKVYEPAP